ncbi:coiled-coil domain-containing protein 86 isoform X2 [Syngnathus scovelli]|uniref:coiled-coil domain-containing protein 86 isoform X2 n=1 Tax=Syngnathus scovelli TaxID=161590 RepID=UPI0021107E9F|nr:coiled-coil domain-containing protein 86 isoform X2 [Syngnathus scovelli]
MSKSNDVSNASKPGNVVEDGQDLPPMTTRTRSGRVVRRPYALQSSETPVRTPSRRTRKSVITEQNELEEQAPKPVEENPTVSVVQETVQEKPAVCGESETVEKPAVGVEPEPEPRTDAAVEVDTVPTTAPVEKAPATPQTESQDPQTESQDPQTESQPPQTESQPPQTESQPPQTESRPPKTKSQPPKTESQPPKKKPRRGTNVKQTVVIPLGKPKSGRVWKNRNKQRFSALVRDAALCTSWEKKMQAKREKQLVQKYSSQLKEQKAQAKEEKRKRREENLKRREENERKAEVVEVIRNTAKLKRMRKKQLRKIEKRDTLALLEKSNNSEKKNQNQKNNNKTKRAKKNKSENLI